MKYILLLIAALLFLGCTEEKDLQDFYAHERGLKKLKVGEKFIQSKYYGYEIHVRESNYKNTCIRISYYGHGNCGGTDEYFMTYNTKDSIINAIWCK